MIIRISLPAASVVGTFFASEPAAAMDCIFFEHWDYQGRMLPLSDGEYVQNFQTRNFNDIASSVRVRNGCTVKYWFHAGRDGMGWQVSSDRPRFRKDGGGDLDIIFQLGTNSKENDSVSSAACECTTEASGTTELTEADLGLLESCVSISVSAPATNVFSTQFENKCDRCITFEPIAEGQGDTPDLYMYNFMTLGQPVNSVDLLPGDTVTLFARPESIGYFTWISRARNAQECRN